MTDANGYTFTQAYWCGRCIGIAAWTPAGSCLGVFADLATARRMAGANKEIYSMDNWRRLRRLRRNHAYPTQ